MKLNVIENEDGELCLEFTDEQMKELGLSLGDTIEWFQTESGQWGFRKVEEEE